MKYLKYKKNENVKRNASSLAKRHIETGEKIIPTILLLLILTTVIFLFTGCTQCLGDNRKVAALLNSADRTIAVSRYTKRGSKTIYSRRIEYGEEPTKKIVTALLNAKRDPHVYNTPVCMTNIKLYAGPNLVFKACTGAGLIRYNGKQYRDWSGTLHRLIDKQLAKAEETILKTSNPTQPGK